MDYTLPLPDEVIDEILETAVLWEGLSWSDRIYTIYTVSAVCPRWKKAAIVNPNIWRDVTVQRYTKPTFIFKALKRAQGGDLTIRIDTQLAEYARWGPKTIGLRCRTIPEFLERIIPLLAPKFSQVRGLSIQASDWMTMVSIMTALSEFNSPARLFWISTLVQRPSMAPLSVTPWLGASALPVAVYVTSMFPTWTDIGAFASLTVLRVAAVTAVMCYCWPQLRTVLEASPRLALLELDSVCCTETDDQRAITLPMLKILHLVARENSHISYLRWVSMPSVTHLKIDMGAQASILYLARANATVFEHVRHVSFAVQAESHQELAEVIPFLSSAFVLDFRGCDPGVGELLTGLAEQPSFRLARARKILMYDEIGDRSVSLLLDKCFPGCTLASAQEGHLGEGFEWCKTGGVLTRKEMWFSRYGDGPELKVVEGQ